MRGRFRPASHGRFRWWSVSPAHGLSRSRRRDRRTRAGPHGRGSSHGNSHIAPPRGPGLRQRHHRIETPPGVPFDAAPSMTEPAVTEPYGKSHFRSEAKRDVATRRKRPPFMPRHHRPLGTKSDLWRHHVGSRVSSSTARATALRESTAPPLRQPDRAVGRMVQRRGLAQRPGRLTGRYRRSSASRTAYGTRSRIHGCSATIEPR